MSGVRRTPICEAIWKCGLRLRVYMMAGLLSGLSGIVHTARAISGQAGVGVGFELDAIAAAVIGGTSLSAGVGRMTGTVIGAVILGVLTSGFTFLNVDAHCQEIIKGGVIVAAVVADQCRQRRRKAAQGKANRSAFAAARLSARPYTACLRISVTKRNRLHRFFRQSRRVPGSNRETPNVGRRAMRRRDVLALLAGAAAPWPFHARAAQAALEETVGFTGQTLFLATGPPALVIGAVRNGQASVFGFGRRSERTSRPPDADTVMRIGSVTKAFTGQVLASLAADGVVSLTDRLTKYAPEFEESVSEGGRPIRLIDLATHSAGLPREAPHEEGPPGNPFVRITREAFIAWLKNNPLLFTPGTSILYSNFGYDLLAAALSAAARKPYPELLAERVLTPLSLADTTFAPVGNQTARLLGGYNFDGGAMPFAPTGQTIVGSGGLYSTPRDLLRWLQWHLDRFSDQRAAERLIDHAAYLWRDGLNAVFGVDEQGHMDAMGLGWVIMQPEGDRPLILQKAGGLQGVFSYVAFVPARNIGVVAAINTFDIDAAAAVAKTANALLAQLAPR